MPAGNFYQPAVSYWSPGSQDVRTPDLTELMGAITQSNVVLMFHGYNNTQPEASAAYTNFLQHLADQRTVNKSMVGIYWPGANWESGLYYMQALGQVEKTAPILAQGIYDIAKAKGYLQLDIVTHSLGGRLALETVKQILKLQQASPAPLVFGRITMMAGAVPVAYLQKADKLQDTLPAFQATQSIYSLQDTVLHWAFPAGQTVAGQGFFPVALGRKQWSYGSKVTPAMDQKENYGAGHGDYWGADSSAKSTEKYAADQVYDFLKIGPMVSRSAADRVLAVVEVANSRTPIAGRVVDSRTV